MNDIKNIQDLIEEDFDRSPYWMFYSGKNSEYDEFVNLIPSSHEDYNLNYVRLIKTEYILSNGDVKNGYMYEDVSIENHTLYFGKNILSTWYGTTELSGIEICDIYEDIGLQADLVFPIKYKTINTEYSGIIDGFGFIENDNAKYKK